MKPSRPVSPAGLAPAIPANAEPDPFPSPPAGARGAASVTCAARSDRGKERPENQDQVAFLDARTQRAWGPSASASVATSPGAFAAVVCDGMGGEAGGAIASHLAVEAIVTSLSRDLAAPIPEGADGEARVAGAMLAAVEAANRRIRFVAKAEPRYSRMGTTATVATLASRSLVCAQVGDSRAYVLRDGHLVQLTRDQTMLALLRESGLSPTDADGEPIGANVILQAVGSSPRLDVVVTRTALSDGDVVVLCSDGLHGVVEDEAIARTLTDEPDLERATAALIDAANAAGGPDNVSCVAFRISFASGGATASAPAAGEVETVRLLVRGQRS